MKKVFFVLAVCAVVSAALVGCGSSSSTEAPVLQQQALRR